MGQDTKYTTINSAATGKIEQLVFNNEAKASKELTVEAMPFKVIADATTAQLVGKGSVCRVKGTTGTFIAFGDVTVSVPTVTTPDALELDTGFIKVVATDNYVRTSVAIRIEVIQD